jgi:hypothetical protein
MSNNNRRESTDDLSKSRYITKAESGDGVKGLIILVKKENVAKPGAPVEMGRVVYFENLEKGLVLNKERGLEIAAIAGSKYYEDWPGTWIEMYEDPTVKFGSKVKGGIRVRKPQALEQTPELALEPVTATDEVPI